jgi:hypothetical protein
MRRLREATSARAEQIASHAPALLADLRARRLARRLIEVQDRVEAAELGLAGDLETLTRERDLLGERLARAAEHLDGESALRRAIEDACAALDGLLRLEPSSPEARPASDRLAVALIRMRDVMRTASQPPPRLG